MSHSTNKKRQATTTRDQHKKSKVENHSDNDTKSGGLFDDLDEEMDPEVLDSVMQQLNDSDQGENDSETDDDLADDDSTASSYIPEVDPVSDLLNEDASEIEEQQDEEEEEETIQTDDDTQQVSAQINKPLAGKFRDHYMGQMTMAFGSDLDTIRQEPGFTAARLNVLIDSLEAGISIFSDLEKTIALDSV